MAAIAEGGVIYDNIRKFIRYLLGCNVGEVLTMLLAAVAGLPLPLVPIQILWMNLVTDGLPAVALSVDPGDPDIMERGPRSPQEGIFARGLHLRIALQGLLIGLSTLTVFVVELFLGSGMMKSAQTMAFTTLVMSQLFYVFSAVQNSTGYGSWAFGQPLAFGSCAGVYPNAAWCLYIPFLQPVYWCQPGLAEVFFSGICAVSGDMFTVI